MRMILLRSASKAWLWAMVAALVLACVAITVAAPAEATFPGSKNGRIVYEKQGNQRSVWSVKADGSDDTRLASGSYPSWSPDGKSVAFTCGVSPASVCVMKADGSGRRRITDPSGHTRDEAPTWSPDGSKIAFKRGIDIWVVRTDGTNLKRLTNGPGIQGKKNYFPDWSPDGKKIAFQRSYRFGPSGHDVFVMASDGTNETNLTPNTPESYEYGPSWSPDGKRIAFLSTEGRFPLSVMNADGSRLRKIRLEVHAIQGWTNLAYSPDGQWIAFSGYFPSVRGTNIGKVRVNGTSMKRVPNTPQSNYPDWQPLR